MRWTLACLLLLGCEGSIFGVPDVVPPIEPPVDPLEVRCATELAAGWGPLRRVTHEEYDNSVQTLLSTALTPSTTFPRQAKANGFTNNSVQQTVGELQVEGYFDAAEVLATEAVTDLPGLLQCDVATLGQTECGHRFIDRFGARAFRRPLSAAERTAYRQLFTDATTALDFSGAIEVTVLAVLQSPHFLYHVERGPEVTPGLIQLDADSLAARMATALWQGLPDVVLLQAASSGELDTPTGIEAQARRMLGDARARPVVTRLFAELTRADELDTIPKDLMRYPDWDTTRGSMRQENVRFVQSVVLDGDGKLETLFGARHTYVDARLAQLYGLPAVTSWTRVDLTSTPRIGLMTQGAFLAVNAKANQSSPVLRGLFVRENLLCNPPPPPPMNANIIAPDPMPGVSTRQRFAQHSTDPACAGCHSLMDPIGLGFENYDAVGAWRTFDEGFMVDATGEIVGTDVAGPFDGVPALAGKLAQSKDVGRCMGNQAFRYLTARHEADADTCSLFRANKRFVANGTDLRELLIALTASDAFRYRKLSP